jgi:hypothetical protein
VKKTVREYQRRFWCGRWPLITFLLGPIPLLILTWLAAMLMASLLILLPMYLLGFNVNHSHDGIISTSEYIGEYLYRAWHLFATPALVMYLLARLASRAAMGSSWICLSATILALFVGLWACEFPGKIKVIDRVAQADEFMVVISLPMAESWKATWSWYTRDLLHICQFLLPIAIAATMILRAKQLSLRAQRLPSTAC